MISPLRPSLRLARWHSSSPRTRGFILASLQADGFRIFLASPSGLDECRRTAREQFEHIRLTIASPQGIDFDPIGWEDIPPGFGRPQSVINPKLDACNVLIGILGKQLGTPTGAAASGFVEEYERMATRAREGEDVAIWIYTLQLTPEDLADPGEKLKAVLAFRERLYKEALVKEFRNVDHLAAELYRDLVSLVLSAQERRQQRNESVVVPEAKEARPAPKREASDAAGRQLQELMAEAATDAPFLPQGFREERFPLARLALWLSTWEGWYFTNETFGAHRLNGVYAMRAQLALSPVERRHVLRTMCAHQPVAPGWAILGYDDSEAGRELLTLAAGDADDAVRTGAFEMLQPDAIDACLAREDVDVERQVIFERFRDQVAELSDSVRDAMIGFAERIGGDEARDLLATLADRDPTKIRALRALIRWYAAHDSGQALELAASADIELDERTLMAVCTAAREAELGALERLAAAADDRLRIVAVQLLLARGADALPALVARLDDPAADVALAAFIALCELGDPRTDVAAAYAKLAERDALKHDDDLRRAFDRTRDTQSLRDSIDWLNIGTASAYQVLAQERWDEFRDAVRRDLRDHFKTFADESRARITAHLGVEVMEAIQAGGKTLMTVGDGRPEPIDPKLVEQINDFLAGSDWNDRRFALAALAGIARNGEAEDAPLTRPWLDSEDREVREAAALALARVGTDADVGKLLELSELEGANVFGRAALRLSPGPSGAALALLDSSRAAAALVGARHLYSHASDLSDETLELLLHHTSGDVRRVGVACALTCCDDGDLEDLMDRYTSAGRYYYNVISWLDRAVFAPSYLREQTRKDLAAFAGNKRVPEFPVFRNAARRSLVELLRSRPSP